MTRSSEPGADALGAVLVANRGEIACRIHRACRAFGVPSIAVYSDADAEALHVREADDAVHLGPAKPAESYLDQAKVIDAARRSGARAIHPGYGFLAENADFARAVEAAGLVWIGPHPDTVEAMADKERARARAEAAGVPVLPASPRLEDGLDPAALAEAVGYPLIVKAAGGGGGIGMRRVDAPDELAAAVTATRTMAERAFGNPAVFLERYVPRARHVEVQVFGFGDGRAVHLFERECSIQRRFQKIVEEAPAPGIAAPVRAAMAEAAVALAERERYRGAGTVEFLYDDDTEAFFFLEMNTRIQVEHPVTEMITGRDLVLLQLRLAAGDPCADLVQDVIEATGHAVEVRLYAEDPARNFLPSPGRFETLVFPEAAEHLRIETGLRQGDAVTAFYDPMIAKLVCHGQDRGTALERLGAALAATRIEGLASNRDFLVRLMAHPEFAAGRTHTAFVEHHGPGLVAPDSP